MKGSSRTAMKDESASAAKSRIGTRSTGRVNTTPSKRTRTVTSASSSPSTPVPRSLRSISPGTTLGKLRVKKARLEKDKDAEGLRPLKSGDTTPKHAAQQKPEEVQQVSQGSQGSQSTPVGAGIRTRLSTGSIQMNGTMTISAAKEKAEMDQIIKQITKSDTVAAKTPTSGYRKRVVQTTVQPNEGLLTDHPPPKKRKIGRNDGSGEDNCNDYFCWLCHKEGTLVCCELCPRVYHTKCLGLSAALPQDWVCPECEKIMRAECVDTRSKAMEMLTIEQLCTLLKYALERMKHAGSEPFQKPVDLNSVPNYLDFIFHPMDLSTLEKNIKKKMYGCTEALLADAKWILHNCIIYNGAHSKLTSSAKMMIKICKHEMNEIELCPDCYLNSCVRKNDEWFSDTCRVPHTLVWAKLKGYPFWPSKALREVDGQVDVRFFGAHDRSWVSVSQCFLLSKNIPTSLQKGKKNNGLDMAIEELNLHVKKIREKFGGFEYAPFRTPYDKTDSYKPISLKPELSSKPNTVLRLSQKRESKAGSSSSFANHKPNILRKSAVAKIRNKYSAMVTLKKIEMTPEKGKKKSLVQHNYSDAKLENESVEDTSEMSDNQTAESENINKGPDEDVDANKGMKLEKYSEETSEDKTKEKVIKKSFVSSNLIEQIENKLKCLVDEPLKADNETSENESKNEFSTEVKTSPTSEAKEIEKETDKTEISETTSKIESENKSSSETNEGNKEPLELKENVNTSLERSTTKLNEKNNLGINKEEIVHRKLDDLNASTNKNEEDSKDSYRKKLDTMIKSCKEKLGMDNEDTAEIDSAISDNEEDDDSTDDVDDDSDDESAESESEETNEEDKEVIETESEDSVKDSRMDEETSPKMSVSENKEDEERKKSVEPQNCETVCGNVTGEGLVINSSIKTNLGSAASDTTSEQKCLASASESNENKSIDLKTTDIVEKRTETDNSKTSNSANNDLSKTSNGSNNDLSTEEQTKSAQTSSKEANVTLETESPKLEISNKSTLKESPKQSDTPTHQTESKSENVSNDESKSGSEKSISPLSEKCTDKMSGFDEDSDSDRLIIDLEEENDKTKSKKKGEVKHGERTHKTSTSVVIASPKADIINIRDDTEKVAKEKKLSQSKESEVIPKVDKPESTTKSFDITDKTQSTDLLAKSHSTDPEAVADDQVDKTQSENLKDMTQSTKLPDKTQSNKLADRMQSCDQADKTQSDEQMDIDDDGDVDNAVEDLSDDFSTIPLELESRLPLNVDSSLPDKNFVKPANIDSVDDVPTSSKLAEKFSKKLLETIQKTVDEMCSEVMKEQSDTRNIEVMNQKLAQARWNYFAELNELKHNFQLTMYEMKAGWESEKEQMVKSLTAKHNAEKELAVKETKKKQWCAQCGKEAIFYCCWNTSYCDYPCQQNHWPQHMHTCLQTNKDKTASSNSNSIINQGQQGLNHTVGQSAANVPVTVGPSVTPQTCISGATPPVEPDHLRRLQDNLSMALQREEEKRGEVRPGVSPKFSTPMSSAVMQNIRQPGPGSAGMMFNMQPQSQSGVMQQMQRTRFLGQQQMAMQVQQRSSLPQSQQQGNPRMLFSQPLIQQAIYPLQVQPQQQLGGTILFQNPQQNLMTYGMPPRPY